MIAEDVSFSTDLFDRSLTERLKTGESAAFDEAFRQYHRYLYNVALRYLKSPSLAEDALQEVFVKLWLHRDTLDGQRSLKGFLAVTMRHQVLNMIRDEQRAILRHVHYHARRPDADTSTEDAVVLNNYTELLETGVAQLPAQRQRIFRLRSQQGFSNEEVAEMLHLSATTVKTQYYHATQFLRTFLRQNAGLEPLLVALLLWCE